MEKSHAVLIEFNLKSNRGLAFFRQNQILRSARHSNLQNNNSEDFFIQLSNAWLHFTNNIFPPPTSLGEILDQPLFLNPHINCTTVQTIHIFIVYHSKIFLTNLPLSEIFVDFYNLDSFLLYLLETK